MCVYNAESYLREAIDSILAQTFSDFEFLIIDDASIDHSRQVIERYRDPRIRLVHNPTNIGLTRSLNRGLELARGDLVARQDADDVSFPMRLARQVAYMDAHQDVCVLGTQARFIDSRGGRKWVQGYEKAQSPIAIRWQLMFDSPFVHTSVMFRREWVWTTEGGYNSDFVTSQDFELWSRLAHHYRLANLPEKLVALRLHSSSVTSRHSEDRLAKIRALMRSNFSYALPDYPQTEEWIDLWWFRIYNHHLYGAVNLSGQLVRDHLTRIRRTFAAQHPEASSDRAMPSLQAALMIRSAFALAIVGAPRYWTLLHAAAALSPWRALVAAPRVAAYAVRRVFARAISS